MGNENDNVVRDVVFSPMEAEIKRVLGTVADASTHTNIRSIVVAFTYEDGTDYDWTRTADANDVLGSISRLAHHVNRELDATRPAD